MIVKNEASIILRCLESVRPLINYWVIVDTGSNDGTQELILNYLSDIPGELFERNWVDFSYNRNEALKLAKDKADYLLFIDADEQLIFDSKFKMPHLEKDFYYITTNYDGMKYQRVQLIHTTLDWAWSGVVHEVVMSPHAKYGEILPNVVNLVRTDGNRAKDSARFLKDAQLLEKALEKEPNHPRNLFYLAQSYRDAGDYSHAIEIYTQRISLKGWEEEVFWSMLQIGILQELMGKNLDLISDSYLKAYNYRPTRAEPLYHLANLYRRHEKYKEGYEYAFKALHLHRCEDVLFVEDWIYQYGVLLEFAVCAYWTDRYCEAWLASQLLLNQENLPCDIKSCVIKNLDWIHKKLYNQNN